MTFGFTPQQVNPQWTENPGPVRSTRGIAALKPWRAGRVRQLDAIASDYLWRAGKLRLRLQHRAICGELGISFNTGANYVYDRHAGFSVPGESGRPRLLKAWQVSWLKRAARVRAELTQPKLSAKFGIGLNAVSWYVNGRHKRGAA